MPNYAQIARPTRGLTANALRKMPKAWQRRLAAAARFVEKEIGKPKPTQQAKIKALEATVAQLRAQDSAAPQFVPPGHFYSAIPLLQDVLAKEERIFDRSARTLPGIDLREEAQLELLKTFAKLYADQPFAPEKKADLRYHFDNPAYSYSDAIFLQIGRAHV